MKIGILTQPLHNNYGGLLQCYALLTVLKRLGNEPIILNREYNYMRYGVIFKLKQLIKNIVRFLLRRRFVCREKEYLTISQNTRKFVENNINPISNTIYSTKELKTFSDSFEFDAIIVGSDQVWRPCYSPCLTNYFFDFLPQETKCKRIAYAASFGVDTWEFSKKQTRKCKELIKKFDFISVREDSAIDLCKRYLDVNNVEHVLDPTLLLKKEDYVDLVLQENEPISEGSLFFYLLDKNEQKMSAVEKTAQLLNLKPFMVMPTDNSSKNIEERVYPTVTKWLRGFMDAKFVVTDSFHGVIFSILFNIPFVVISNETRGSARFYSVLKMFSLENRLIKNLDDLNKIYSSPINWDFVNNIHEQLKKKSYHLLISNLSIFK